MVAATSAATRIIALSAPAIGLARMRVTPRSPAPRAPAEARTSARRVEIVRTVDADQAPVAHDADAIAHRQKLIVVGGDEDHALARGRQPVDQAVDGDAGADVDALRRLVEDEEVGIGEKPAGDDDLLLVAAGEIADLLRLGRRRDLEFPNELSAFLALARRADQTVAAEPSKRGDGDVRIAGEVEEQARPTCGSPARARCPLRSPAWSWRSAPACRSARSRRR